jgi:DNA-binding transcriptional ArsR family regulator
MIDGAVMVKPDYDYVPPDELDDAPLSVAISPLPTVFTLMRDSLQGGRRGTPLTVRRSILANLRRRDALFFTPLSDPQTSGWPTLLDAVEAPRETLDEALQRLSAIPGAALVDALDNDRDVTLTPSWDAVRREPDRWMRGFVDALHRGWRAVEPLWRRSAGLLEREEERIGAAIDAGVSATVLAAEIAPRAKLVEDTLRFAASPAAPRRLGVDKRGLTVAPLIASSGAGTVATPGDFLVLISYPLRDAWLAFEDQAPPSPSLEALLGDRRSALLQRLDRPQVAGRLALAVGSTPSALSFHLRALEAAGLVRRERRGSNIVVHRTSRGTQLVALYTLT